ncbi:MAG: 50S ribosomal protein L24 [Nanoarchaeota archaeon]
MKPTFSSGWRRSVQPRKQRKFVAGAPLHVRKSMLSVHLSEALRKEHGKRSAVVRKGDKVRVLRGNQKGKEGKVERVSYKDYQVFIAGVTFAKKDGSNGFYPVDPSNLMITELDLSDPKRKKTIERK